MAFTKTWGEAMFSERLNSSCYTSDYSLGKIDFTKTWGEAMCSERLNSSCYTSDYSLGKID
jgi:hypothetical protein